MLTSKEQIEMLTTKEQAEIDRLHEEMQQAQFEYKKLREQGASNKEVQAVRDRYYELRDQQHAIIDGQKLTFKEKAKIGSQMIALMGLFYVIGPCMELYRRIRYGK